MQLYQFAISHYCEKVRWTLHYKNLKHEIINLLPGLHSITTKKLGKKTHLPILVDGKNIIQNSSNIITYLDETYPDKPLTPNSSKEKHEALKWESYVDEEIGVHLRRYFYFYLLQQKKLVAPLLTTGVSKTQKVLFSFMFPVVRKVMQKKMNISSTSCSISKEKLEYAINKVHCHLQTNEFMVGNIFTRSDLTVASLLAPLFEPQQYGLNWPKELPYELAKFQKENMPKLHRIRQIYDTYRI